jgi:MFS family permease
MRSLVTAGGPGAPDGAPAAPSTWAPLRRPTFRAIWTAQFVANIGTWAQTVGAQWLMGDLQGGPLAVALVQTAATLPVFLLVVPAGALGDIFDRRRLLIAAQWLMITGATALAALTAAGLMTPALLLLTIAVVATGAALATPSFAAIQPELVPPQEVPHAALLNGANLNVARAVGPALGGVLISVAGPAATFTLNAVSFLGVIVALRSWERDPEHRPLGNEQLRGALRAGLRYVRSAPAFATVLARTALFIMFGSVLWALLPVVARTRLGLGASGYGLLLASIGAGAVTAAFVIPVVRGRLRSNEIVAAGTVASSAALLVVGLSSALPIVIAALAVAGFGWIAVMSSLSATAQMLLPNWTRARGLAFFTLTFMGGQALGSVAWGIAASAVGLKLAFIVASAGLAAGLTGARRLALTPVGDVRPMRHWPEPHVVQLDLRPDDGPILVSVEWQVREPDVPAFVAAMTAVARARRRTGARLWGLFRDIGEPELLLESFVLDRWEDHLRQHLERGTAMDAALEAEARRFAVGGEPREVRHLVWAAEPSRWAPPPTGSRPRAVTTVTGKPSGPSL